MLLRLVDEEIATGTAVTTGPDAIAASLESAVREALRHEALRLKSVIAVLPFRAVRSEPPGGAFASAIRRGLMLGNQAAIGSPGLVMKLRSV